MAVHLPIYMDHHATTPVDPRVAEAMLPYLTEKFGNAGSAHSFGQEAKAAVDDSRARLAAAIGAEPDEIVFTSGATESNNLAIRGVAGRQRRRGDHLVSVVTEHEAVLDPLSRLERKGFEVTLLGVSPHGDSQAGRLDPDEFADVLRDDTLLASVMLANNEIGVVHPIEDVAEICRRRGVLLHCDATQGVGRIPVDVRALGVDLLSLTAHKTYGPKGTGALYVRSGRPTVRLEPQVTGGGQERGVRSGTLNVAGIVGLAAAVELAVSDLAAEMSRLAGLRRRLWEALREQTPQIELCGPALDATDAPGRPIRLPGNLNVLFNGIDGETLMLSIDGVAVSTGATCASADPEASHVLRALGLSDDQARSTLRFGLGRSNTADEVDYVASTVAAAAARLRV